MPKVDLSLTITGVIAICAIVSPIAVAIVNNIYALKFKKMEIRVNGQTKALESYLIAVGNIIDSHSSQKYCNYEACKCIAYAYAPKGAWSEMDKLDKLIKEGKFDDARKSMTAVGKAFSKVTKQ